MIDQKNKIKKIDVDFPFFWGKNKDRTIFFKNF